MSLPALHAPLWIEAAYEHSAAYRKDRMRTALARLKFVTWLTLPSEGLIDIPEFGLGLCPIKPQAFWHWTVGDADYWHDAALMWLGFWRSNPPQVGTLP